MCRASLPFIVGLLVWARAAAPLSHAAEPAAKIVWTQVSGQAPWSPRDSSGEVVYDGKMWLLGGFTPKRVNDVWYSADGEKWHEATGSAAWGPRNLPASVVHDGKMWIMGGVKADGKSSWNDVWYSTDGADWHEAAAHAPWSVRGAAGAVVHDDKLWIIGGFDAADFTHHNDVWHSTDGAQWQRATSSAPWTARSMHASLVFDGKMWVIGGGVYDARHPHNTVVDHNDVWCSSDGENWHQATAAAPWTARRFHCAVVYDDKMWVLAGYHHGNRNDVWYSSDGTTWQEATSDSPWSVRHEPSSLVFRDRLWLMGGSGGTLYHDVWTYRRPAAGGDPGRSAFARSTTSEVGRAAGNNVVRSLRDRALRVTE